MAFRYEQNALTEEIELVIDGFQNGTSDSPLLGLADMRNINIDSIPGIALCNYKLVNQVSSGVNGTISVSNYTTGQVVLSVEVNFGDLIVVAGLSAQGVPDGVYYFAPGAAFHSHPYDYSGFLAKTLDPSNGFSTYQTATSNGGSGFFGNQIIAQPKCYTIDSLKNGQNFNYYILDNQGYVWTNYTVVYGGGTNNVWVNLYGVPSYAKGNYANGNGLVFWNKYLFVFRDTAVDIWDAYGQESTPYIYTKTWGSYTLKATAGSATAHPAIWGQDNNLWYGDTNYVGEIYITNLANPYKIANFSINQTALQLPGSEIVSSLCEPSISSQGSTYLYIGSSTSQYIYPWSRTFNPITQSTGAVVYASSFDAPLVMPEIGTFQMININKIVYILAGTRGNIYYTNGSSIVHFSKVPYNPANTPYPIFTWGGIMSLRNNLVFGVADANNNASGVYSIALAVGQMLNNVAGAIRYIGQPSGGNVLPTVLILNANGLNYYSGSAGAIDYLDTATPTFHTYNATPATSQGSYIESDLIPIGTALQGKTFNTIEYKLDTPLVNGEKIRICVRSNLSDTYVQALENIATSTYLPLDGSSNSIPIQYTKWIQVRADLQTISGGSFVRLKEIRLR